MPLLTSGGWWRGPQPAFWASSSTGWHPHSFARPAGALVQWFQTNSRGATSRPIPKSVGLWTRLIIPRHFHSGKCVSSLKMQQGKGSGLLGWGYRPLGHSRIFGFLELKNLGGLPPVCPPICPVVTSEKRQDSSSISLTACLVSGVALYF